MKIKKIMIGLLACVGIILTSCTNNVVDTTWNKDAPNEAFLTNIGLADTLGILGTETVAQIKGTSLKTDIDYTQAEYFDVKVSTSLNSSLLVYNVNINNLFKNYDKVENLTISALTFRNLRDEDKSGIISAVFDSEYGITKEKLGVPFDIATGINWVTQFSAAEAKELYKSVAESTENDKNLVLSIVYLPVYLNHQKDSKSFTTVFAFVPVYYSVNLLTGTSGADEKLVGIKVVDLPFEKDGDSDSQYLLNQHN